MTSSSASSRPVLNAAATARAFYEPLARDETRRAVERWRSARERHAQAAAAAAEVFETMGRPSTQPGDRIDTFKAAIYREYRNATAHLIRLLVAWDPDALDNDADNAERQYWPPRGAIVDGVLYAACPIDPEECEGHGMKPGDPSKDDCWVMDLQVIPLKDLVNLDADQLDAPPAATVPGKRTIHERPEDPFRVVESEDGNVSESYAATLNDLVAAELHEMATVGPRAGDRTIYQGGRMLAVIRRGADGAPSVVRFD